MHQYSGRKRQQLNFQAPSWIFPGWIRTCRHCSIGIPCRMRPGSWRSVLSHAGRTIYWQRYAGIRRFQGVLPRCVLEDWCWTACSDILSKIEVTNEFEVSFSDAATFDPVKPRHFSFCKSWSFSKFSHTLRKALYDELDSLGLREMSVFLD